MELTEALRRRRMVRDYDPDRSVPGAAVDAVIAAALRAPSAGFTQGVSLLVWTESADRDTFWSVTSSGAESGETRWLRGMRTATCLISVWTSREAYLDRYARPDKGWQDRDLGRWSAPYWYVDAGMAAMAGLLAAVDEGLGACFFGVPVDRIEALRAAFGVPSEQLSVGVISLGHPEPDAGVRGSAGRVARRPSAEVVHRDRWSAPPP